MIYLSIAGFVTLCIYIVTMAMLHGVQEYVSDNFYVAYNKWLFSVVMVFAGFSFLPYMMELSECLGIFALLTSCGLILVGLEPHYKTEFGFLPHNIGAYTALIAGTIYSLALNPLPYLCTLAVFGLVAATSYGRKHLFYFGECFAIVGICLSVLLA